MFGLFSPDPSVKLSINGNKSLEQYGKNVLNYDLPILTSGDKVTGHLQIIPPPGKAVVHFGVMLLLIGEHRRLDGTVIGRFFTRKQELIPQGELKTNIETDFTFDNLLFPESSYFGQTVNTTYAVQLVVIHRFIDFKVEERFIYVDFKPRPAEVVPIHKEIGIENILHIEFVFPSREIDCREPLVGAVYFIKVNLRIVAMSLTLFCEESYLKDGIFNMDKKELKKIEIMDGSPCRGDHIPIRFFIASADIWPFDGKDTANFNVEHYIKATLVDENGKKYYKKLNINFARYKPQ